VVKRLSCMAISQSCLDTLELTPETLPSRYGRDNGRFDYALPFAKPET
jgi:hypothetical protein